MTVDYIIIGQGLCGTWLSYYLLKAGASVLVIDRNAPISASTAASGIINPVTGKRLARQWMGDIILPFAANAYAEIGRELNAEVAKETTIHNYFSNSEEAQLFEQKASGSMEGILTYRSASQEESNLFNSHYGVGVIQQALIVEVRALLQGWRAILSSKNACYETDWDWKDCRLSGDAIVYKDINARKVIDCAGAASADNPYFNRLPFALNKGETMIASIIGMPRDAIYKHGTISIVPWEDHLFWIGSSFDWDFKDEAPSASFRAKAEATLQNWLKLPIAIHEHFAAIRPATVTRDAFAGLHPKYPQIGILNGMGAKGCSLAPFLANNLANHLVNGTELIPQTDIARYAKTLNRD